MNLLQAVLSFDASALSPVVLKFTHTYEADDIVNISRNRESANTNDANSINSTHLTFTLHDQTVCWRGDNMPRPVRWDGRGNKADTPPEKPQPKVLEVVPYGPTYLDNDDYYMLLPAVAINDLKTPGPMIRLRRGAQKFSVDKHGIIAGTPVTLLIDIPHKNALLLNYGFTNNITSSYITPLLSDQLKSDVLPTCLHPVITLDELDFDIDWEGTGEAPQPQTDPDPAAPNPATPQSPRPAAGSSPARQPI